MGEASFGKYRLIAELGHGGMADVFLAVIAGPAGSGFSKLTVVKRLRQNLAEEPEFVEMLVDEARISARLNHPNVVQTNEVGSVGNVYFLAMEYLDGQPFHRIQHRATQFAQKALAAAAAGATAEGGASSVVLPTDPFPRECQYLVLLDTLAGLHHAHELSDYDGTSLQIVHRDVTPHNVFVTYEGQVKVVDFGIAKAVGRASETRQGVVKGKVRYMAPEQAIGQPVDRRADVFSVGVMLWEAATGRRLWKDMDDLNIVQALVGGNVKSSPREVVPDVPEEIDRICKKALAHNRDDRYASAEDFRLDLEQYLAESGTLMPARRKIGPAVSALFNDKRTEIRQVIEKQLQALKARTSSEMKPVQIPVDSASGSLSMPMLNSSGAVAVSVRSDEIAEQPTAVTDSSTQLFTGNTNTGRTGATSRSAGGSRRAKGSSFKSKLPMIAAAGAAVVAIAALALGRIAPSPAATRPVESVSTTAAAADVRIKLTVSPASATITIDGQPVSSPYLANVPRDSRDHIIRVEAPGLEPHVEIVRYEGDITMLVTLTKANNGGGTGTVAHATTNPTPPVRGGPVATPPVTKATVAAPPTSAPPPTPVTAPTTPASTHKPVVKQPEIDKGDPWGTAH
jgi:serine/threonine-protein kinase